MNTFLTKIASISPWKMPVGSTAFLLISMGLGAGVVGALQKLRIPPILAGAGLSKLMQLGPVTRMVGEAPATIMSTGLFATGTEMQFGIMDKAAGLTSKLPALPEAEAAAAATSGPFGAGELAEPGAGELGQGEETYLSDVEQKIQGILSAQM